jgi:two-component system NarL family response regulator
MTQLEEDSEKIRLLIVDDHPVIRTGLSTMLQQHQRIVVVASVDSGEAAIELLRHSAIDVVLLDLRMPGMSGISTLRNMLQISVGIKVIILSAFEFDEEIHQTVMAGARGYIVKDMPGNDISDAIYRVYNGSTYFPKRVADRLSERRSRPDLSKREVEILEFVCKGFTNKEIASALQLSEFTVRNHLNHVTSKLEVTDRTEAAFVAIQTGIVSFSH